MSAVLAASLLVAAGTGARSPVGATGGGSYECDGLAATIVGTIWSDYLVGTPGDDVIVGRGGNDVIRGRGGDDVICGDAGHDLISGGGDDDHLLGGPGNDLVFGQHGDDDVSGGPGRDHLYGGRDDDVLRGDGGFNLLVGGPGTDDCDVGSRGRAMLCEDAVNQPPDAADDAYGTDEDTTIVVAAPGVLANDTDPDGDPLVVGAVDGNAADVGVQVALASGALATLSADGSLGYDPNGKFDSLGIGDTATDSFTYTVADGNGGTDTATVTITISGVPFRTVVVAGPERTPGDLAAIGDALAQNDAGVPTTYIGVEDFGSVVQEAIDTGGQPTVIDPGTGDPVLVDVLYVPAPQSVGVLAASGAAVPAAPATEATVVAGWPADWVEFGTVDGTFYGVPAKSDLKSLIWYKPSTFRDPGGTPYPVPTTYTELLALTDTIIANGQTPWCVGNGAGFATGFVFTDWVEDRVLGSEPPSIYDDWVANDVSFTDPRIRAAWNDVVDLWNTPGAVFEGLVTSSPGVGITETSFFDSVLNFAVDDSCLMHKQANFAGAIVPPSVLPDMATFRFPADDAADDPLLVTGVLAVALDDDLEVALLHEHIGTVDYADARQDVQNAFGSPTGFLSAVAGQDLSLRTPVEVAFTTLLQDADTTRFDASDLMPPEVGANGTGSGFWGEGTRAAVTPGSSATVAPITYVGTTVDDATQIVADIFCTVAPGTSCP